MVDVTVNATDDVFNIFFYLSQKDKTKVSILTGPWQLLQQMTLRVSLREWGLLLREA